MVNQTPDEGCLSRATIGSEGSLLNPIRIPVLPAPTLSGRSFATMEHSDLVGKDLSSQTTSVVCESQFIGNIGCRPEVPPMSEGISFLISLRLYLPASAQALDTVVECASVS
jgi:hypothetical protein